MSAKKSLKMILSAIIILTGVIILFVIPNLLASLLLAIVSYYFLTPLIFAFKRLGLSQVRAAQVVFFGIGVLLMVITILLGPMLWDQSRELFQLFPEISRTAQATLSYQIRYFELQSGYSVPKDWMSYVQPYLTQAATEIGNQLPSQLSHLIELFFLAPLFIYFYLTEASQWPNAIKKIFPHEWGEPFEHLLIDLNQHIGDFIRARLLESLLVGALTWGTLSLIGLPFAFLLGFLAGFLNIIPYLGPVMAAVPAIILALSTDSPQTSLSLTAMAYVVIQALDAFVIVPFFVAKIVKLHSLVVIVAILLGGYLMGLIGMIISIPLAGMLKILLNHSVIWLDEKN